MQSLSNHSLASRPRMGDINHDNPGWAPSDEPRDARSILSLSLSSASLPRSNHLNSRLMFPGQPFWCWRVCPRWLANRMQHRWVTLWLVRPIRLGKARLLWQFPVSIRHPIYKSCLLLAHHYSSPNIHSFSTGDIFRRGITSSPRPSLLCKTGYRNRGCARKEKLHNLSPRVRRQCRVGDDSGQIAKPIHNMSLDTISCFQGKQAVIR